MNYVIIGRAQAGKTTTAKILSNLIGIKSESTSSIVYEVLARALGVSSEALKTCSKEKLRPTLIDIANYLCELDPCILSKGLLNQGYNIIDGIRRYQELDALKQQIPNIKVFYIKRDSSLDDNFNVPESYADYIIDNNGTKKEIKEKLIEILKNEN